MPEIITGDMPTPVKYHSKQLRSEFQAVEDSACRTLIGMLPEDLQECYTDVFFHKEEDEYLWKLVKAADKISALIKCIEEEKAGNSEFKEAKKSTLEAIKNMHLEEVDSFMADFIDSYTLSLDEQK